MQQRVGVDAAIRIVPVGRHHVQLAVVDDLEALVDREALLRAVNPADPPYWAYLWTGAVELTFDPSGRIDAPSPYGRPAASPLGSGWAHFWIAPIGAIAAPPSAAPGSARLVSADVFNGRIAVSEADPSDPEASFARAEGRRP